MRCVFSIPDGLISLGQTHHACFRTILAFESQKRASVHSAFCRHWLSTSATIEASSLSSKAITPSSYHPHSITRQCSHMPAGLGQHFRRGSDASATIGTTRWDSNPYSHETPRPSYVTVTSLYSTRTTDAIDRLPQSLIDALPASTLPTFNPPATTVPASALPLRIDSRHPLKAPVSAYKDDNYGMRVMTRSDKTLRASKDEGVQTNDFAARPGSAQQAAPQPSARSTQSDGSFEVVSPQAARNPHRDDEAMVQLYGAPGLYSPPHFMSRDDFMHYGKPGRTAPELDARWHARNQEIRANNPKALVPVGSIAALEAAERGRRQAEARMQDSQQKKQRLQHELQRGAGPETSFNVYHDDAVLLPEPAAIPYASNSPKPQQARLLRSLSNRAHQGFKRVAGFARRGSDAAKAKISAPTASRVDERSYPDGPTVVNQSLPVREAQ